MIDLHADLNYENRNGDTAVSAAARVGGMDALSALLAAGARGHHENNFGFTALTSLLTVDQDKFDLSQVGRCRLTKPRLESAFGFSA
jgi:ankyrin repeat protein